MLSEVMIFEAIALLTEKRKTIITILWEIAYRSGHLEYKNIKSFSQLTKKSSGAVLALSPRILLSSIAL